MLRELADGFARPLSVIFQRSWWSGEVPYDWKKANVTAAFRRGKEESVGNARLVGPIVIPGKMREGLTLENISKHVKDKMVIGSSQPGFADHLLQ